MGRPSSAKSKVINEDCYCARTKACEPERTVELRYCSDLSLKDCRPKCRRSPMKALEH